MILIIEIGDLDIAVISGNVNIQFTHVEWGVTKGGALTSIQRLTYHLLGLLLVKPMFDT